jgi:hypothetical protein
MKCITGAVMPMLMVAVLPLGALAQQRHAAAFPVNQPVPSIDARGFAPTQEPEPTPNEVMGQSGMFLGIVSMLAGSAIGGGVSQGPCKGEDDGCTSRYAFTGALIAGTLLIPIGVHFANKQPRNLMASMAASALVGGLIYFGTRAIPGEPIQLAPFLAAPVQMYTSIRIETR